MMTELERHKKWITKLISDIIPFYSNSKIQKKHLHLLVRWFPQIDQHGNDGYEKYIKCKNRKSTKTAKKNFLECENFIFSKEALFELISKEIPDIYPEHNPPVAEVVENLIKIKYSLVEEIISYFEKIEYKVIILTTEESKRIPKEYHKRGTYKIRLQSIFGKDFENYIATSTDIDEAISNL